MIDPDSWRFWIMKLLLEIIILFGVLYIISRLKDNW